MRNLVVAVVVALAGVASAQTPDDPPASADQKSVSTAMEWSVGVTTIGVAGLAATAAMTSSSPGARSAMFSFGGLGLLVGPSLGRMYAGTWFSGGEVVRAVGLTVIVMGEALAQSCLGTPHGSCNSTTPRFDAGPIAVGGAVMLLGAVFDLGATPGDVERHNRALGLSLQPAPLVTAHGTAAGVALSGRF